MLYFQKDCLKVVTVVDLSFVTSIFEVRMYSFLPVLDFNKKLAFGAFCLSLKDDFSNFDFFSVSSIEHGAKTGSILTNNEKWDQILEKKYLNEFETLSICKLNTQNRLILHDIMDDINTYGHESKAIMRSQIGSGFSLQFFLNGRMFTFTFCSKKNKDKDINESAKYFLKFIIENKLILEYVCRRFFGIFYNIDSIDNEIDGFNMKNKKEKEDKAKLVGERIRILREHLRLSRPMLEREHKIPEITLKNWESASRIIRDKNLEGLINIFQKYSNNINPSWLRHGIGEMLISNESQDKDKIKKISHSMKYEYNINNQSSAIAFDENDNAILLELLAYIENNHNAVILKVSSNTMKPSFNCGDYIGGKIIEDKDKIRSYSTKDVIVKTKDDKYFIRRLSHPINFEKKIYSLHATNIEDEIEPVIYGVEIDFIAPIEFMRRRI